MNKALCSIKFFFIKTSKFTIDFSDSCSLVERRRSTVKMSEMKTDTVANSGNFVITELAAVQIYESDTLGDSVSDSGLEEESCYYS